MTTSKAEKEDRKKLVDNDSLSVAGLMAQARGPTKKRIWRTADPHIRRHLVKGRTYYTYCRGTDREIYLGDADDILRAVKRGR